MTAAERIEVTQELQATAGILGRRLSEDVAAAYVRALDDLPADTLVHLLRRLARTAESGARFPTPTELRQRSGGAVRTPDAPLSDVALARIRQAVYAALASWEQSEGLGSARPIFEAAWQAARRREGWGGTVIQREQVWQAWLRREEE